jgi:hypothetical protein
MNDPYRVAQLAMAELKSAVRMIIEASGVSGITNAQVGRSLGIYGGHVGHEGHVSRTLLAMLEEEGVVFQEPDSKIWRLSANKSDD